MLGFSSKFGSVKGMVAVPNLSGLTVDQATTALQNIGLVFGGNSLETTSNSGLNGTIKINSQSIATGTLVDYETKISVIVYNYVYVPPAVYVTGTTDTGCQKILTSGVDTSTCSGYTRYPSTTYSSRGQITTYYSDGTFTWSYYSCAPIVENGSPISNSPACGYQSPSCMPTSYTTCSGCVNGYNSCSTTYVQSDCSTYTVNSSSCCSSTTTSYGAWSSCACGQRTRTVTTTTTCGSSTTTSTSTQTSNCSGGPC